MPFTLAPPRSSTLTGSAFGETIRALNNGPREQAIYRQFELGNLPEFMRTESTIEIHADGHVALLHVLPDYLCVGTDEDFLRVPINPMTAQRIADMFGAVLPTRKIVDAIWRYASVKLAPITMSPAGAMTSTGYFIEHNTRIEAARDGRLLGALVAGTKKDIVVSKMLGLRPDRVAIYGWHKLDGVPIQPLNVISHSNVYADYSHGVRLVSETITIDSRLEMRFCDLLRDPVLWKLVSDEGPHTIARQPKT